MRETCEKRQREKGLFRLRTLQNVEISRKLSGTKRNKKYEDVQFSQNNSVELISKRNVKNYL